MKKFQKEASNRQRYSKIAIGLKNMNGWRPDEKRRFSSQLFCSVFFAGDMIFFDKARREVCMGFGSKALQG